MEPAPDTTGAGCAPEAALQPPAPRTLPAVSRAGFCVVSDDSDLVARLVADLDRRFGRDHDVTGVPPGQAEDALQRLAVEGRALAILIVDERLVTPSASELFGMGATCTAATGPPGTRWSLRWRSARSTTTCTARGLPLERILHPAVSDFLAAWDTSREADVVPLRMVGPRRAARSPGLRDKLTRVALPYWCYDSESEAGRSLLGGTGRDGSILPVVAFHTGVVLDDPTDAALMEMLGLKTRPSATGCDVMVIGAGPAGWRQPSRHPRTACRRRCSSPTSRAAGPAPARWSATVSAPPVV